MQVLSTISDDLSSNLSNSKIDIREVYIDGLYNAINVTTPLVDAFDNMMGPMVCNFFSEDEIKVIHKIITHTKDRTFKKKFQKLDAIIKPKGFKRSGCGTNRVLYEPLDKNATFCIKIALDRVARKNNPDELVNQKYLKPFVAKCYDVSDDGNIGIFERVIPIENLNQFWDLREDIFNIMERLVGRFIIDDFGSNTFKNWGFRKGFGPVLLDYADMYILDPKILYCTNHPDHLHGQMCGGEIDYDDGFNKIICTSCGAHYMASDFKHGRQKISVYGRKRKIDMGLNIKIYRGEELMWDNTHGRYDTNVLEEKPVPNEANPETLELLDKNEEAKREYEKVIEVHAGRRDRVKSADDEIQDKRVKARIECEKFIKEFTDQNNFTDFMESCKSDEISFNNGKVKITYPDQKVIRVGDKKKPQQKCHVEKRVLKLEPVVETLNKRPDVILNPTRQYITVVEESSNVEAPKVIEVGAKEILDEALKDLPILKEKTMGNITVKNEEENENMILLKAEELIKFDGILKDGVYEFKDIMNSDDRLSYTELLDMNDKIKDLVSGKYDGQTLDIETIIPAEMYGFIQGGHGTYDKVYKVNVDQFKELCNESIMAWSNAGLDASIEMESEFEDSQEPVDTGKRKQSKNLLNKNY